jgi:hypothetical protein
MRRPRQHCGRHAIHVRKTSAQLCCLTLVSGLDKAAGEILDPPRRPRSWQSAPLPRQSPQKSIRGQSSTPQTPDTTNTSLYLCSLSLSLFEPHLALFMASPIFIEAWLRAEVFSLMSSTSSPPSASCKIAFPCSDPKIRDPSHMKTKMN